MIIYEVKLKLIDRTIYSSFILWLTFHIKEMLQYEGFLKADVNDSFKEDSIITVKYLVQSNNDLNHYIENHSQMMRGDAIKRFKNSFQATRKIYKHNLTS